MLDSWILRQQWTRPSKMVGLYLYQIADDTWFGEVSILKKTRKSITVIRNQWTTGPFDEVLSLVPEQSNLCLAIDGKGVIINELQSDHESVAASQMIPGGKEEDFYLKQIATGNHKIIAAITRRDLPDQMIDRLNQKKCQVFDLSVGPLMLNHVGPYISHFVKPFRVPFREIAWENQAIETFRNFDQHFIENSYNVSGEEVSAMHLNSFSHAFAALLIPDEVNAISPEWFASRTEISYRQAFNTVGTFGLGFFFLLLLLNYLVFNHFDKKLNINQLSFSHSQEQISLIEKKKKELQWRKQLAQKTGMTTRKHFSYYTDQLAATIPNPVSLTELTLHPVEKTNNTRGNLTFADGYMDVKGKINISADLNQWLLEVKELSWVDDVEVRDLKQETLNQPATFAVRIKMKE